MTAGEYKYIPNYSFEVQLGLTVKINFSKISNISAKREFDVFMDGGVNDRMYFFEKAKREPDVLTFHKGLSVGGGAAILAWLSAGVKINDIMILVKKDDTVEKIFYVEQGILTNISFSDLDAQNSGVIIKSMEIHHTGVKEIPV